MLVHANAALADSPIPERTWPGLVDLLGIDLLAKLVGIAPASARRYLAVDRATSRCRRVPASLDSVDYR